MPNFTDHMKRIIYYAEQSLLHAQKEEYGQAAVDVMTISNHATEAMQQLDEISLLKYQGKDPAEKVTG